jgi:hypothetical protein
MDGVLRITRFEMPLKRYFGVVGGLLLVLLLVADWYFPGPVSGKEAGGIDKSVIRITSAHRWPDRIVFDTNQPTIFPPPIIVAEIPARNLPREAFAQLPAPIPEVTNNEMVRKKFKIAKRRSVIKVAAVSGVQESSESLPAGW